jgi:hypothetical protein
LLCRYREDVYDRIWTTFQPNRWTQLSTSVSPDDLVQSIYKLPANASAPFDYYWYPDNVNDQYYLYVHFNEVEKLAENETRSFNITLNGVYWAGPLIPKYQETLTIYSIHPLSGSTRHILSLLKTESSTLPPIINALEIYIAREFSLSESEQDDGK